MCQTYDVLNEQIWGVSISVCVLPGLVGVENEPKPCAATDPAPVLNEPLGFCSPNELLPKLMPLAPLFPNRLVEPAVHEFWRSDTRSSFTETVHVHTCVHTWSDALTETSCAWRSKRVLVGGVFAGFAPETAEEPGSSWRVSCGGTEQTSAGLSLTGWFHTAYFKLTRTDE